MSVLLRTTSPPLCHPRWSTPRTPGRPTLGGRVAQVAETLGTPLMPWQRHVADVALEIDPDSGLLAYRRVVLTVPRQSGKTTELLSVMVHRAQAWRRQRILYTAQTRLKARKKWEEEHVTALEDSRYRPLFKVTRQIGQEGIHWRNGSIHGLDAPSSEAGHGDVLDLGVIDEAFAQVDARVEQGFAPAMITRPQPQLWVVSTAGKSKGTSPYLWGKVEAGRVAAEAGITAGTAFFEWAAPSDADPADPATWWACMPALGWTVTEDAVRAELESMDLAEFRRAYLNIWNDEAPDEWQVIARQQWEELTAPPVPIRQPVAFAADMSPNMASGSIGAAFRDPDGLLRVEIPAGDHRPGTAWMVDRLLELYERYRPCAVVIAAEGDAAALLAPLQAKIPKEVLLAPSATQRAAATGQFFEAVTEAKALRHLGQTELTVAVAQARRQTAGDHWWWTRKDIAGDVSPLIAVTLAAWGHAMRGHLEDAEAEPWMAYG